VTQSPAKPLLVFDGDCGFCRLWIRRCQQVTGPAVDYLPAQDPRIAEQFPEIPRPQFAEAVQLIDPDGEVFSGAEAVFRTLAHNPSWQWPLHSYESFPLVARGSEWAYRLVANHRPVFSTLTRWGWGPHVEAPSHFLVRRLFLRALALVYFFAFLSLWTQVGGLIGHDGILPTDQFMSAATQQCDEHNLGLERFHLLPTLCWINASDGFLDFQCAAGTVLSLCLLAGLAPAPCLGLLWLLFLSLVVVGRDYLGFQWDGLLLETGFLAIFLAPLQVLPRAGREAPPSRLFVWLLRLLLFKLMFSSGCVKLLSGDPNWRNLTALTFHYQTQPLPPWTAWYANQLPLWFQKFSCAATFVIEIGAPFLIFGPRRVRFLGAGLLAGLQVLILVTGNYAYFNWLSLALCALLLDDFLLEKFLPRRLRPAPAGAKESAMTWESAKSEARPLGEAQGAKATRTINWPFPLLAALAVIVLTASGFMLALTLGVRSVWLAPAGWLAGELAPFRTVNNYGLFAVMTTQRNEIIIEGSNDRTTWLPYEFKYKPGELHRRPAFIAPFQPRLDWQMWFAALGSDRDNPWFGNLCVRLLQGSPAVRALLAKDPFPNAPPRWIRAEFYHYQFTDAAERRATGAWWRRKLVGEYLPVISLDGQELPDAGRFEFYARCHGAR
jgi:predicted DCC family thiol-disulfide oxidoreductase YuxK